MKAALAALWILSLAAAFGLARLTAPERASQGLDTLRSALEARDPLERSYRLSGFFRDLAPEDLPGVLEEFEGEQARVTRDEVRLLMLGWSRFDAPAAFAWARDWPSQWRDTLMGEAISAWGFRDGRAALAALEGIEEEELQERLRGSLLQGWMASDNREGIDAYLAAIENPRQRNRLTLVLTGELMKSGPEAATRWAESVPEDLPNDFKRLAFFHAASSLARDDPRRAAEWFEAHRRQPYSEQALEGIARSWAQYHDAVELFDWLRSLAADARPDEISDAMMFGFRAWQRRDPEAAEAWLETALPDPLLDAAVAQHVRRVAQSSGRSAIEWALRIRDGEQRDRSLRLAGRMWLREEPEAARAWLEQSDLPEATKGVILAGSPPLARQGAARAAAGQGTP